MLTNFDVAAYAYAHVFIYALLKTMLTGSSPTTPLTYPSLPVLGMNLVYISLYFKRLNRHFPFTVCRIVIMI